MKKRDNALYAFCKRAFDIVASLCAIIVLALPMAIIALCIKKDSPGPAFYRSIRVGKGGKEFVFLKFRTMVDGADKMLDQLKDKNEIVGGVTFKMTDDPRVTRVGKVLRKYSIDEFPQLFCILKGDMSVVGPRPGLPEEVNNYDQRAMRRLEVQQGLSGEWQIRGRGKKDISFDEMIDMDIDYIDNKRSFFYDLKIVVLTVFEIFRGRGK